MTTEEPNPFETPAEKEDSPRSRAVVWLGALAVLCIGTLLAGLRFGPPGVILALAAATLVATIAAMWASLRTLIGETRLTGADAYAIGAPRVEEEQKRAVLRALKDLEFERAVGKISEEDYRVLVARYRREAKRLLRLLDEASADQRARAEKLVEARLKKLGLRRGPFVAPDAPAPAPQPSPPAAAGAVFEPGEPSVGAGEEKSDA